MVSFWSKLDDWLVAKLGRITSGGNVIREIDGLRFIAIFSVILFHVRAYLNTYMSPALGQDALAPWINYFLSRGFFGVQLFFAISGFILALPFAKHFFSNAKPVDKYSYFRRRITRLEPPYVINLVLIFFLLIIIKGQTVAELFNHLIASIFYMHNFAYNSASMINSVAWSLEVEIQFYILMPFLAYIFHFGAVRWYIYALIVFFPAFVPDSWLDFGVNPEFTFLGQCSFFFVGIFLADIYVNGILKPEIKNRRWDVVGLISWLLIPVTLHAFLKVKPLYTFLPLLVILAYVAAFKGILFNKIFTYKWIYIIGGMCYTIYLYHHFFMSFLLKQAVKFSFGSSYSLNFILFSVFSVPIIIIGCSFLFYFIEKPFMKVHK